MMAICGAGAWLAMTMRQPSFCAFVGVSSPPVCLRVRVAGGTTILALLGFSGVDDFYARFIGCGFLDE